MNGVKVFIKYHIIGDISSVGGWDIDQVTFTPVGKANVDTTYAAFRIVPAIADVSIDSSRTNGHHNRTKQNSELADAGWGTIEELIGRDWILFLLQSSDGEAIVYLPGMVKGKVIELITNMSMYHHGEGNIP